MSVAGIAESTFFFIPRPSSKKNENFKGCLARSQSSCGGQFKDERPESLRPRRTSRPGIKTSHRSQVSGAGSNILGLSSPGRAEKLASKNTLWSLGRQSGKWTSFTQNVWGLCGQPSLYLPDSECTGIPLARAKSEL